MAAGSYLPELTLDNLSEAQRDALPYIESQTGSSFSVFQTKLAQTNQLIGPFGIFLHSPPLAHAFFGVNQVLSRLSSDTAAGSGSVIDPPAALSPTVREVVILTVGAHFGAGYEMYAHGLVARAVGLDDQVVEEIVNGGDGEERPKGVSEEEVIAWEVARALTKGKGALDRSLWEKGNKVLGQTGMYLLVQYVGYYCWVCVVLNGFGAVVPATE